MFEIYDSGEVGSVLSWKVDLDEDGANIQLFKSLVFSREFEEWTEATIKNNGSNGKFQVATTSTCACKVIMFDDVDCHKAMMLAERYRQGQLSFALDQGSLNLLFAHVAVCKNQLCPAKEFFCSK